MKPTAKVIGFFSVVQIMVIVTGWFATRALRKSFFVASGSDESTKPVRDLADVFATYGLWGLLIPPLWFLFTISTGNDTKKASDTSAAVKEGLVVTLILFVGCLLAFMDMVLNFSTLIKAK
ncbi:MAG: hypothetical protein IPK22_09715 [Verrucomicrobiaceae bacterium]|nr:hypothetical protein [Verrucomicrobiaceae bacterium]